MAFAYSPDALVYDSQSNTWQLRPDYDHTVHRVEITITDDDPYLTGDRGADEVGADSNQLGVVRDLDGNIIAQGQIYDEFYYELTGPGGETIFIERIEIAGEFVGWLVTAPLEEGVAYTETNSGDVYYQAGDDDDPEIDTELRYDELQSVPCFTAGTVIATQNGFIPVGWLRKGDLVVTRDRGLQPVKWIGRVRIPLAEGRQNPGLWPIRITHTALGQDTQTGELVVSPWHRLLLSGPELELHFGLTEALAAAKHLLEWPGVEAEMPTDDLLYYHILFDRHELILADGHWAESLFLGGAMPADLPPHIAEHLGASLPEADKPIRLARPELKLWEVALLRPAASSSMDREALPQMTA